MSIKKSQSYLVDSLCDQLSVWLNTQLISKVILSYTHKNVNAWTANKIAKFMKNVATRSLNLT